MPPWTTALSQIGPHCTKPTFGRLPVTPLRALNNECDTRDSFGYRCWWRLWSTLCPRSSRRPTTLEGVRPDLRTAELCRRGSVVQQLAIDDSVRRCRSGVRTHWTFRLRLRRVCLGRSRRCTRQSTARLVELVFRRFGRSCSHFRFMSFLCSEMTWANQIATAHAGWRTQFRFRGSRHRPGVAGRWI